MQKTLKKPARNSKSVLKSLFFFNFSCKIFEKRSSIARKPRKLSLMPTITRNFSYFIAKIDKIRSFFEFS